MALYQSLNHALILTLTLSMPVIIAATAVGVIVGLIQALTQIQDQTLPHAVKLAAVAVVIMLLGAGLAARLVRFAADLFGQIASY